MNLDKLRSEANAILAVLKRARRHPADKSDPMWREAVNWADLRCIDAQEWLSADGDRGYRVEISEAAPECPRLSLYVANELKARLGVEVDVVTSW